jgi:hypothetical protein
MLMAAHHVRNTPMGRVKDHFHEEICSRANEEPWGPEPADIEQFYADREIEMAKELLRAGAPRLEERKMP